MEIYLRRNVVDPFLDVGIPNKANWKTGTSNRNSEEFVAMILLLSRPGLRTQSVIIGESHQYSMLN